MITAIDTNILLDLLVQKSPFQEVSRAALLEAQTQGALVICEFVYAELSAAFCGNYEKVTAFLKDLEISLLHSTEKSLLDAGKMWAIHRKMGGSRQRLLLDFLIGAHAKNQTHQLLTRDRGFYRESFKELRLLNPT